MLVESFKTILIKEIELQLLGNREWSEGEGKKFSFFITSRDFPLLGLNLPAHSLKLL